MSITQPQPRFASPNVGTGLTVTTELGNSNFAPVSGTSLANYSLPTSASGTIAIITPRRLGLELIGRPSHGHAGITTPELAQSNITMTDTLAAPAIAANPQTATVVSSTPTCGPRPSVPLTTSTACAGGEGR